MSFPLAFKKYEAIPLSRDPAKVLIRWDILPTKANLTDFEFYIDRGDGVDQLPGFQHVTIDGRLIAGTASTDSINQYQVGGPINAADFYQYVDYEPYLRNLNKEYYYRIRVRKISTQEEISTKPFTWNGDLDLIGIYIAEEHNFLLEDAVGVPSLVHLRKRGGMPCRSCFDAIQKKRTASHCTSCFGTNWEGGFYNPIDLFVDYSPNPKNESIAEWGATQENQTTVLISNYPEVGPGDVIRELRTNRLWRVVMSKQTEKRRTPMLQFVRVVEIPAGDIEHKIPFDEALALKKVEQLECIRNKREF